MDGIDFDKELSIFLVEARLVLWNKTDGIYNERNETKEAWTEVCICFLEDFEAVDVPKKVCRKYCHYFLTQLIEIHTNFIFYHITYPTVHIFDTVRC